MCSLSSKPLKMLKGKFSPPHSLSLAEEYQDGHTKLPTVSPRIRWDISYQGITKAVSWVTDPQKQSRHWNKAAESWPKVRVNTAQVAVSYSVMWSIKPPRPAVIQKVWKKAKSAQISKAAKQVQAWQQAFCSSRPLENIGKGIKQGGKKLKISTCLDCLYPTVLQLPQHTSPMRWRWLAGIRKESSWGQQ